MEHDLPVASYSQILELVLENVMEVKNKRG